MIMKTMKLNIELAQFAILGPSFRSRPAAATVPQPKEVEVERNTATPAWAWGFSPMLPWGTLKEEL
jgi:hypothetical protein